MKRGKMELADGGTLFLDEIGEMPLSQQAKLLRALEDKEIVRIGGQKKIGIDFRLICATNRKLEDSVREGSFREDLYFRIGVISVRVPPLRERKEDIPLLVRKFLDDAASDSGSVRKDASEDLLDAVRAMPLRGNVRELKNPVQRLYVFSDNETVTANDLDKVATSAATSDPDSPFARTMEYSDAKSFLEKTYIETQLKKFDGNISRTAIAVGMLPNNLMRKMKTLGIGGRN
jgi:two-component system nitrogen regulation response regulator NtrX